MDAISLLKSHGVAITAVRIDLLSELASAQEPMSWEDFTTKMNKTSFYRNMELFEQSGIVKKLELSGRGYYVLSEAACAFFVCESCHKAEQIELPKIQQHINSVLVKGLCDSCEKADNA